MIELINVRKRFDQGDRWVTNGVTLTIPSGQMTCIIGASGEGKSVLLKQIIGLIKPTSGSILIDGVDITKLDEHELETIYKKCGYVFQFAALLDSLTVFENVGLSLLEKGVPEKEVLAIAEEKLAQVNLKRDVLFKYPSELSGGMKKRVGLARTLIMNPSIILYDEPTTGLDPITARIVHELMHDMQKNLSITSVVISHDVEIFKYVDNIALLYKGAIHYFGPAKTIWECNNPYIYQFIRGLAEGPIASEKSD
jgi:phospholipid/cholesterol/gamma-HCH transport system ATP-binding protein